MPHVAERLPPAEDARSGAAMIRAVMRGQKGQIAFLGIDASNLRRLQEGNPIFVEGAPLGLPVDIMIHYRENMQDIIDELKAGGIELPPMAEA